MLTNQQMTCLANLFEEEVKESVLSLEDQRRWDSFNRSVERTVESARRLAEVCREERQKMDEWRRKNGQ